uniref:hypothetical protein n=1 Tax=Pedobacter schmidteae TaxID=2201271 RepID=UPI000EADE5EF|nr:hypothetical protein [Pedobacter schmidteae]
MNSTKICAFNLPADAVDDLRKNGVELYDGCIGKQVTLNYGMYERSHYCLPQSNIPKNLHEYNVVIIDLTNVETIFYDKEQHKKLKNKSTKEFYLTCYRPQNLFDSRAFVLRHLQKNLTQIIDTGALVIIFCSEDEKIEYHYSGVGIEDSNETINMYSFHSSIPDHTNKNGEIIKVSKGSSEINNLLRRYADQASYHITFTLPQKYENGKYEPDKTYVPLMLSNKDEVVSFYKNHDDSGIFYFPDIRDKKGFLKSFLQEVAPNLLPKIFPNIAKNKWLEHSRYALPNQKRLDLEKQQLKEKYDKALADKEKEINENNKRYQFLRDLLIETDDTLVQAVIKFLIYIGFENVVDADTLKSDGQPLEEDIQIETTQGLIIIEVKGIGGTSTDSECSQIGKIRYRRIKQRNKLDVFPHYVVNHQRHLPVDKRVHPPFNENQITDAENDDRGLATTWQLFNLYHFIDAGVLTKDQVRSAFYGKGYLNFIPNDKKNLGKPKEFFQNNTVIIIDLQEEIKIKVNDKLLVIREGAFKLATVLSIQLEGKSVSETAIGEVGFKLDISIAKGSSIYF